MDQKFYMRQIFSDWHMPNFLPEIKIDYDDYFENIKRTGAQTLIFQAKNAHGNCLFPSKVGITNRSMKGDIFGEIVRRSKETGLQLIAYYNMILSWELVKTHPEWQQVDRDGNSLMYGYPAFCMSNDDFKEQVCQHMEEIARNYETNGFFLDLQYFLPKGCFCASCQKKFQERFGYQLSPTTLKTTKNWLDFINFKIDIREQFILENVNRCNALRPGLIWMWNGSGAPHHIAHKLDLHATFLTTEAHPPNYLGADLGSRFMEASNKPFVLMMPESQGSWGDWTVTTVDTLIGLSGLIVAHGGALNINHVPYPCGDYAGKVAQPVWDAITATFSWVKEREPYCRDKRTVPVVGCPISESNIKLFRALHEANDLRFSAAEYWNNVYTLHQLLSELHLPLDFFYEEDADASLKDYELVVLPDLLYISKGFAEALREYVKQGGNLLATYQTSLMDEEGNGLSNFSLSDLLGADFLESSPYSVSYLDRLAPVFAGKVPEMPLLLKDQDKGDNPPNHVLYCQAHPDTEILGYITDPVIESDFSTGYYIYHKHSPPGACTEYPGIVVNTYGEGKVIFLPVPFFQTFRPATKPDPGRSPFLKEVLRVLIQEELGASRKIRVEAPASIKMVLMQDEEGWLLHLIHIQKETDSMYLDRFERKGPIRVKVKPAWRISAIYDCLNGERFQLNSQDDWGEFSVPSVVDHRIIRVEKA